ncbi:LLM class flavin-dependent oxidoreductase [Salinispora arenicola]|uniref:LLM class flavin-dependent oxidoreductase n=1 Tax=Salinispora arenicola TaxID=168697 RepID=UPI00037935D7|nr:LLM class flavin-dependent oxidoreductase [Salinispora arenicola]NIL55864.1 LLM class flavin-dependent oxidoreductase [Salinispora arenicola]
MVAHQTAPSATAPTRGTPAVPRVGTARAAEQRAEERDREELVRGNPIRQLLEVAMSGGVDLTIGYELPDTGLMGSPGALVAAARAAETAGVDYLVFPDRPATATRRAGPPAAVIAAPWIAAQTSRIGLVVTGSTAYHEPYHLARMVASLDHVSAGRAGWQVVTGPDHLADANHRREGVDPAARREDRAAEYVPVVRDLWDSWEDGAFVRDKATGQFLDEDCIHVLDHVGPTLHVRGPLNLARPPQGHPVVFASVTDRPVAPTADVLIVGDRAPEHGADADQPHVLAVVPFVGRTGEHAAELHARAGAPRGDHERAVVVGDPDEVTEHLSRCAVAGFTVRFPDPSQVAVFTDEVLPRLRPAPSGRSDVLRDRLGLPPAANRFTAEAATGAERS